MAGGMTYTAVESTALSTAEYYGKTLVELGAEHPEVVALTADLGKSTKIGMFGEAYPDRFFNVGIAEQNMFGVAARYGESRTRSFPFDLLGLRFSEKRRPAPHRHLLSECQR